MPLAGRTVTAENGIRVIDRAGITVGACVMVKHTADADVKTVVRGTSGHIRRATL